jgi:hypothetical protein
MVSTIKKAILTALILNYSASANAALMGTTVTADWEYMGKTTKTFVVESGIELDHSWLSETSLDVGDDYFDIRIAWPYIGLGEGLVWTFTSLDYNGINGVKVSTNFTDWSDSFVSFTNNSVKVSFSNFVFFEPGTGFLRINLNPISTVPEPENLAMLLAGLGLISLRARNKK